MKTQILSIFTAATFLLAGCGKQSRSPGTTSSSASESGGAASAPAAGKITGTWKWVAPPNPDGKAPEITFSLELQGGTLIGTVNKSKGQEAITNGVVRGNEVSFQTIRQKQNGLTTTTFKGKLNEDKITGTIEIEAGGQTFEPKDWEIARVK